MVEGTSVVEAAQSYFYTIIVGMVILIIGFAVGILAKKVVQRLLREMELNKMVSKVGITYNLEWWISSLVSFLIYLVTIVFFLNQLGITSIILYLITGGILLLVILTFVVGLKDVLPNFFAWIVLQRKGKVQEGKRIEVQEISGIVEKVGFLETEIKTDNDDLLYVPNTLFLKSKLKVKN